jgi:hypothetical protein
MVFHAFGLVIDTIQEDYDRLCSDKIAGLPRPSLDFPREEVRHLL